MKTWTQSRRLWSLAGLALALLTLVLLAISLTSHVPDQVASAQSPPAETAGASPSAAANIVKVGLKLQALGPPDTAAETFPAVFDLWFVATKPFDATGMTFVDATAPIRLDKPVTIRTTGDQVYQLYRVSGTFRYRPSVDDLFTNRLALRVALLSTGTARSELVLVPDRAGSQLVPEESKVSQPGIGGGDWRISGTWLGETAVDRATLGDPGFATAQISHSQLVASFSLVQRTGFVEKARRLVPPMLAIPLAIVMAGLLAVTVLYARGARSQVPLRFVVGLGSATLLLAAIESGLAANASAVFDVPQARIARTVIEGCWLALVAAWLIGLLPFVVWGPLERRTGTPPSTLERAGVNVVIMLALGLVFLSSVLKLSAVSIGATSGLLTLILGFTLQSIILDLFSGVLLNVEKPFRLLNWITVDTGGAGVFGQVRNMNWRTTQLQTRDNNLVSVPNSIVAKSSVVNHANPSPFSRAKFELVLGPWVPTAFARQVMKTGAMRSAGTGLILDQPEPSVVVTGIEDYGIRYRILFYVNLNIGSDSATLNSVAENVLAALAEADIQLAFRHDTPEPRRDNLPHPASVGGPAPAQQDAEKGEPARSPLSPNEIELVRASWAASRKSHEEIVALFYSRLFSEAPSLRPLFRTDAKTQRTKFLAMLAVFVKAADQLETLRDTLTEFGLRHQTYGALPEHFELLGDALFWTLEQQLGEAFDEATRAAWIKLYRAVTDMMKSGLQA